MSRRPASVLTVSVALAVGLVTTVAACSGEGAGPDATRSPSSASSSSSAGGGSSVPGGDGTGPTDDGTASGTGNGSGVDQPADVDFGKIAAQGTAAAGGRGTVISIVGSGDSWTVVVAGADGSQTQSVVSATLDRVTSGPFPKQVDAATQATTTARAAALQTTAASAASAAATAAGGGRLASLVLGGTATDPTWAATVTTGAGTRSVSVDGITGVATAD